jgi:hypothetical protein
MLRDKSYKLEGLDCKAERVNKKILQKIFTGHGRKRRTKERAAASARS